MEFFSGLYYTFEWLITGVFFHPELSIRWIAKVVALGLLTGGIFSLLHGYTQFVKEVFYTRNTQ